jgi:peptidoglycan hydrolase-like protein with peptidoglycan-binding domain
MFALSLGSHGDEVRRVEQRLSSLGLYTGAIDGAFGGGVLSAVKAFQRSHNLDPDGVVGSDTWSALFPGSSSPPEPSLASQSVAQRCLALTGTFETSTAAPECFCGLAGNFDGQGISFGVLQWNLGQGTLQPMLRDMIAMHHDVAFAIFADALDTLAESVAGEHVRYGGVANIAALSA